MLDNLVQAYAQADLTSIFSQVGIPQEKIIEARYPHLKAISLAQWLWESGWASSQLATEHFNFAGIQYRSEMESLATKVAYKGNYFCKFPSIEGFILGYWKFITRSPYRGWEAHTNTPENFIGFIGTRWTPEKDYVAKVLKLLPQAIQKLENVDDNSNQENYASPSLQVSNAPSKVKVKEKLTIQGSAAPEYTGKYLEIKVDEDFGTLTNSMVADNGEWQLECIFGKMGEHSLDISLEHHSVTLAITVIPEAASPPSEPVPEKINLSGSVGRGGVNRPEDVRVIKQRFRELGFDFLGYNDNQVDKGTIEAIKLFQAIIKGYSRVSNVDGRIDVYATTHRFLQAVNAPKWQLMPKEGKGFVNYERLHQPDDHHDFGTDWMAKTIEGAGKSYEANFRTAHPQAAPIAINDVSLPHGGDTPDHSGHETGLACDVILPHKNGNYGGITWKSSSYDRPAMRAMLKAIRAQTLVSRVFFNDTTLIREKLCQRARGHDNHAHFEIKPPKIA